MRGSRNLLAAAAASLALSLAGCGGAESPAPPASSERHGVAAANTICAEYRSFARAWSAQVGTKPSRQALARLIAVKRTSARRARRALAAVAAEPAVGKYLADLAASERLHGALARLSSRGSGWAPHPARLLDQVYAAEARAYADGKALGLGQCIGVPPRKPIGG